MEMVNLSVRTDKEVKKEAEILFEKLGINMSTAINIFLRQAIRENGIPFELKIGDVNSVTMSAIEESRKIINDKSVPGYKSIKELRNAIEE